MARKRGGTQPPVKRRYGSEKEVEGITGISARTLQDDRRHGRKLFPWYKAGRKILYDLGEVEAIIQRSRRGGEPVTEVQ
jgi:hypothetical protein